MAGRHRRRLQPVRIPPQRHRNLVVAPSSTSGTTAPPGQRPAMHTAEPAGGRLRIPHHPAQQQWHCHPPQQRQLRNGVAEVLDPDPTTRTAPAPPYRTWTACNNATLQIDGAVAHPVTGRTGRCTGAGGGQQPRLYKAGRWSCSPRHGRPVQLDAGMTHVSKVAQRGGRHHPMKSSRTAPTAPPCRATPGHGQPRRHHRTGDSALLHQTTLNEGRQRPGCRSPLPCWVPPTRCCGSAVADAGTVGSPKSCSARPAATKRGRPPPGNKPGATQAGVPVA